MKHTPFVACLAVSLVSLLACGSKPPPKAEEPVKEEARPERSGPTPQVSQELGSIEFATSGSPAAQSHFLKGALLLHSFEYPDAADEFREAQRIEPGFAMAYWGEAMTYNHPLWAQTSPDQAKAALAKLAPTLEGRLKKAGTEKEQLWLASLEPLYGAGDKLTRDLGYAAALADMHAKYPDDLEVAAFYALAVLGTSETTRDYAIYMKAAALAEDVYAKNPKHPGAVHYLIHAYDDPVHAPLGLRYANLYGQIAPDASHALHMPTHIYFAMGMWDEAAAMNERSAKAADDRIGAKHLTVDDRGYHALLWLVIGFYALAMAIRGGTTNACPPWRVSSQK
jgi:hypothetical protein